MKFKNNFEKIYENIVAPPPLFIYTTLIIITIAYFSPYLDVRNYFIGDDFVWLYQAKFGRFVPTLGADDYSYQNKYGSLAFIYQLIPVSIYNDRPGGLLFIKIIHEIFGLSSATPYYVAILILHIINVALFYKYARIFLSVWPSWIAAALSATWFYAIDAATRVNAIFDVLAFTASIASILIFRESVEKNSKIKYIIGLLLFVFAIRTKEYAIGILPILFLQESIFFNGKIKESLKRISGYIFVFLLIFTRYLSLYFDQSTERLISKTSDYHFSYSLQGTLENFYWYWSEVFYKPFVSPIFLGLIFLIFIAIFITGDGKLKRIYLFSICAFTLILGPVLLFTGQRSALYLYAPHFFVALLLAATLEGKALNKILGILLISFVSIIPFSSNWKHDSTNWMLDRRNEVRLQLESGTPIISEKLTTNKGDLTVFIGGVKPYINAYVNSWATMIDLGRPVKNLLAEHMIYVLGQHSTEKMDDFIKQYCNQPGGKLFLEYDGNVAHDRTVEFEKNCQ
ncbi:hypothetical protein [Variovorax sp. HJSM1_2]|uniref:hypothetical protein n=1 Tax=Variovorax sp. HJSM1_2 TaxID=3366263 RepID=UPI003BE76612